MNKTLKHELKEYFKVIDGREKLLSKELEKCKLSTENRIEEMEARANVVLHKLAKKYMDKKNFDFEKERSSDNSRIQFEDGKLGVRGYRYHAFYEVDFTSEHGSSEKVLEFLPAGFKLAIDDVKNLIKKVENISTGFEKELNTKIKVTVADDNELKRGNVKKIKLGDKFEFGVDGFYSGLYEEEQLYYNNDIFNSCLSLIDTKKRKKKWLAGRLNGYDRRLDALLNNGCENIIIATRLTEE